VIDLPGRDCAAYQTPSFQQYWRLRDTLPHDCVLFFRMGDFYELFAADAVLAAPIMGVQLTARAKDHDQPVPMCGVPFHSSDSYIEKLLAQGLKVALAEQLSEAGKSKLVDRGIVRVFTPGLPFEILRQDSHHKHNLMVLGQDSGLEIAVYEFLGAESWFGSVPESFRPDELQRLLEQLDPREILMTQAHKEQLQQEPAFSFLWTRWSKKLSVFGVEPRRARDLLRDYFVFTQRSQASLLLSDYKDLWRETGWQRQAGQAQLSFAVAEQWNLPELADLLDSCGTAMGRRRLRLWLHQPLTDINRLNARNTALRSLWNEVHRLTDMRRIYDLDRIHSQLCVAAVASSKVTLKALVQLRHSLRAGLELLEALSDRLPLEFCDLERLTAASELKARLETLDQTLHKALPDELALLELHEVLLDGFDAELDRYRSLYDSASSWMESFEQSLREKLQIPSLKLRFNRVFGYYIEVTKTHVSKVPPELLRKQTTAQGERYTCVELQNRERELFDAQRRAELRSRELIDALLAEVLETQTQIRQLTHWVASLDVLLSVAQSCRKLERFGPWCSVEWQSGKPFFRAEQLRHPLIESSMGSFVPNSLSLGGEKTCLLLTGPNMAGKSTLMRQVGLAMLLAQAGFPVPAQSFQAVPLTGFYSRMGASDRILSGDSTFMVEMKETAEILRNADSGSLVLVDEIGRGTSTHDGLAIAKAVLKALVDQVGSLTLFATHYHELAQWARDWPKLQNASMGVQDWKGELVFLRRLEFHPAESSYGLWVAAMAGLPKDVIENAERFFSSEPEAATGTRVPLPVRAPQSDELENLRSEIKALKSWPVEDLSPRELYLRFLNWLEKGS
jgi:DNA mismatch repair protein MutS